MKTRSQMVSWSGILLTFAGCSSSAAALDASTGPHGDAAVTDGAAATDGTAAAVDASTMDTPGHNPGMPGLGAHALTFHHQNAPGSSMISTDSMTTRSGSLILVNVGRGDNTLFALPTDNKGNSPYQQQGLMHPYGGQFSESGTALYSFAAANGGPGFQVSTTNGTNHQGQLDEITLAAVEVIEGTQLQAVWNNPAEAPLTSLSVTTTGPATLIAFWWGDGFPDTTPQQATPNNGFVVIDTNVQELHSFVQCAVAAKNVSAAGTYDVTWAATPAQGAQLWLVAVQ